MTTGELSQQLFGPWGWINADAVMQEELRILTSHGMSHHDATSEIIRREQADPSRGVSRDERFMRAAAKQCGGEP